MKIITVQVTGLSLAPLQPDHVYLGLTLRSMSELLVLASKFVQAQPRSCSLAETSYHSLVDVLKKFARFMIQSIVQDLCISYEPPCVSRVGYLLQEVHHKE